MTYVITVWELLKRNRQALGREHRAANCLRRRVKGKRAVVKKTPQNKASYGNLAACGSVWCCPACALRISVKRAAQISQAVKIWRNQGFFLAMVTYTHRHTKFDPLASNLRLIKSSYRKMMMTREYQKLRNSWSWQVQAYEITKGDNGWHCHIHTLLFLENPPPENLEAELFGMWSKYVVAKEGIGVNVLSVQDAPYARYITKTDSWDIAAEIALGDKKQGGDNYLSFLLKGDNESARHFALATAGLNRLTTSRGFWKYFEIETISESEILQGDELPGSQVFAVIPDELWAKIIGGDNDYRQAVLELAVKAETGDELIMWVESELE